jgi:predicted PurR-regulated permease PerM
MAWFASIAMEPAVARLSRRMRRGAATGLVMGIIGIAIVVFVMAFGSLLVSQVAALLKVVPDALKGVLDAVNQRFGTAYTLKSLLAQVDLSSADLGRYGGQLLGGVLGAVGTALGALFSMFSIGLLTFYLSADGPRLRRWIAGRLPAKGQQVFVTVWQTTIEKTGGYVAARVTLAAINATTTAVVFLVIGMPSWLALSLWTGIVAQFVPTIGTYLAIVLPVIVGLQSDRPVIGLVALGWGILYQQIENLTLEPRISAKATDVHPAVAFAGVLLGTALFGVAGALLAVPVVAVLLSLVSAYGHRHELVAGLEEDPPDTATDGPPEAAALADDAAPATARPAGDADPAPAGAGG